MKKIVAIALGALLYTLGHFAWAQYIGGNLAHLCGGKLCPPEVPDSLARTSLHQGRLPVAGTGTNTALSTSTTASQTDSIAYQSNTRTVWTYTGTGTATSIYSGTQTAGPKVVIESTGPAVSSTEPNAVLVLDAESDGATMAGGGTAMEFRGKSSGGGVAKWLQARIRTRGYDTNNQHDLCFETRLNGTMENLGGMITGMCLTNEGVLSLAEAGTNRPRIWIYDDGVYVAGIGSYSPDRLRLFGDAEHKRISFGHQERNGAYFEGMSLVDGDLTINKNVRAQNIVTVVTGPDQICRSKSDGTFDASCGGASLSGTKGKLASWATDTNTSVGTTTKLTTGPDTVWQPDPSKSNQICMTEEGKLHPGCIPNMDGTYIPWSSNGAPYGVASLGGDEKVLPEQLPPVPAGSGWRHVTNGVEDMAASTPTAAQVGADPSGTAATAVSTHNSNTTTAHGGIPRTAADVGAIPASAGAANAYVTGMRLFPRSKVSNSGTPSSQDGTWATAATVTKTIQSTHSVEVMAKAILSSYLVQPVAQTIVTVTPSGESEYEFYGSGAVGYIPEGGGTENHYVTLTSFAESEFTPGTYTFALKFSCSNSTPCISNPNTSWLHVKEYSANAGN